SAVAVGPDTAGFDDHFLDVELVVDEDTLCGVRELLVHAVDVRLRLWTAMNAVTRLRPVACAADATVELLRERGAWNDIRQDRQPARTRQRFDGGLFELCLRTRALDVHNGRFTRDRHRFFERTDCEIRIHRRGEFRRPVHTFALWRAESRERERHGVGAWTQIHDLVDALRVGPSGV